VDCTALVMDGAYCLSGPMKEGKRLVSAAPTTPHLWMGGGQYQYHASLQIPTFSSTDILIVMSDNHPCMRRLVWANTLKKCPTFEESGESVIVYGLATSPHALLATLGTLVT